MKKFQVSLALLAIVFAVASAFTVVEKATTIFSIQKVAGTNQPAPADVNNPEWYRLNTPVLVQNSVEYNASQLNSFQSANCDTDTKICLVQIKIVDGTATEIKGVRTGLLQ